VADLEQAISGVSGPSTVDSVSTAPLSSLPPPLGAAVHRRRSRAVLLGCSIASLVGAFVVLFSGVILTSGTYGSRMAWLLGVVSPVLLLTAVFAWLASRQPNSSHVWSNSTQAWSTPQAPKGGSARTLVIIAMVLFSLPIALGVLLLVVYAALFVGHSLLP